MSRDKREASISTEAGSFPASARPPSGKAPSFGRPHRARIKATTKLRENEVKAIQSSLENYFGFPLQLDIELDPEILGGIWVQVGDIVIDGSLSGQLEALRHHLFSRCRVRLSIEPPPITPESATT